jgi:hypothetical protein
MGYPVPVSAPQVTVNGRTFTVSAFPYDGMVPIFMVGVFEKQSDGSWNSVKTISSYADTGSMDDITKLGGGMNYIKYVIDTVNAFFAELFSGHTVVVPPIVAEPTNEAEARLYMVNHINGLKLTLVNNVPVLSM